MKFCSKPTKQNFVFRSKIMIRKGQILFRNFIAETKRFVLAKRKLQQNDFL